MSPHEDEDYELVLGNRQLFFLAVVLFGVFFSIGYTVGYSRGRESSDDVIAASRQPAADAEAPRAAPVPAVEPTTGKDSPAKSSDALYSAGSRASEAEPRQAAQASAQPAAPLARNNSAPAAANSAPPAPNTSATSPAKSEPLARNTATTAPANPLQDATSRRATTPSTSGTPPTSGAGETATAAGSSRKASSAGPAVPTPTVAVPEIVPGTLYLQVLASRESEPAREALLEFKSKGHPVTLDNQDPDWFRILVGPFDTREAADAYQTRLQAEGIKSFLRKF